MKKNLFKKAFSLIELLLGLSIIAALTITVFIAYNSYQVANQARVISGDISNIRASVAELYKTKNSYADLNTQILIAAKAFPDSMVKNNYYVYNVLGNQYTINGAAKEYRISIDHVSSNVCIKVIKTFYRSTKYSTSMQINNAGYASEKTMSELIDECSSGKKGINDNFIVIGFRS